MTQFMTSTVGQMAAHAPGAHVAVVQFSSDCRVEVEPAALAPDAFAERMAAVHRINGGTNISLAIAKAGQLLKPFSADAERVVCLLTDGRIDSHQVLLAWGGRGGGRGGWCHSAATSTCHAAAPPAPLTPPPHTHVQAREARGIAGRLADEQANVRFYAFGVGRGVDRQVGAAPIPLFVRARARTSQRLPSRYAHPTHPRSPRAVHAGRHRSAGSRHRRQ